MSMNGLQLTEVLLRNQVTRPYFGGVMSADQVPLSSAHTKTLYVINSDINSQPGSHWMVIFLGSLPEFFDSFGNNPNLYYQDIEQCLINNGPNYIYNLQKVQPDESIYCSLYCLFYIYHKCIDLSMEEIICMLKRSYLPLNDTLVKEFCEYHYGLKVDF